MTADPFALVVGTTRGSGTRCLDGARLTMRGVNGSATVMFELTDDAPLGDEPGGPHVVAWDVRANRYLLRRWPAHELKRRTSGRYRLAVFGTDRPLTSAQTRAVHRWVGDAAAGRGPLRLDV